MSRTEGRRGVRWGLLDGFQISHPDGRPQISRLRLVSTPLFSVMLHRIHTADQDPDPHDHPWWFWSFVLCGGYTELVYTSRNSAGARVHRRGSAHFMPRHKAHRITAVHGVTWTVLVAGPHHAGAWGFWAREGRVPWKDYVGRNVTESA
jgi:hypothetical protein